jgi:hypothetical protein
MTTITCTQDELSVAFAEWMRRFEMVEDENEEGDIERYGEACAEYFVELVAELKTEANSAPMDELDTIPQDSGTYDGE